MQSALGAVKGGADALAKCSRYAYSTYQYWVTSAGLLCSQVVVEVATGSKQGAKQSLLTTHMENAEKAELVQGIA